MESVGDMVALGSRRGAGFGRFGEAEIENLDYARGGELDVGGFEVAMDDAFFVGGFQARGDLAGDGESLFERQGTLEVGAFDQFHHQRALLDAVDGGDIGMIQRRQHLRFAFEARHVLGVAGQRRWQHFDGDVAIQLAVAGAVDFAHAAGAEGRDDFVGAELVTRGEVAYA